jgi:hypothetical protein
MFMARMVEHHYMIIIGEHCRQSWLCPSTPVSKHSHNGYLTPFLLVCLWWQAGVGQSQFQQQQ